MRYPSIAALTAIIIFAAVSGCSSQPPDEAEFARLRAKMVERQLKAREIDSPEVLAAMNKIPRHLFVAEEHLADAYGDFPLPIGYGQTISQPYIVAYMTQVLKLQTSDRVLEIGTGSGYQAAILGELCAEVYSIEIIPQLAKSAGELLKRMGYKNVTVKEGDGYLGWPEYAPFDAIIVTAAPEVVPRALFEQTKVGGRLVAPEGEYFQTLRLYTKTETGLERENLLPVRFVPMIKKQQIRNSKF